MSAHTPPVKWAQRKDSLFLTIDIPDVKDPTIELSATHLVFKGTSEKQAFELNLEFFKPVDPENEGSKYTVRPRDVLFHIMKAEEEEEHWPRLLKNKGDGKRFVKTDWSRYVDEDEEKEGFDTSNMADGGMGFGGGAGGMPGMGGMGGMPGMGGMGGMPGMGGMGGMPGMGGMGGMGGMPGMGGAGAGGFDMSQLQAMMGNLGGGAGGAPSMEAAAAPEDDSDDSDDMPDLEPDTADAGNL